MGQTAFFKQGPNCCLVHITPALEAVWAQLGLAAGGQRERTRGHCHLLQIFHSGIMPLSTSYCPPKQEW